MAEQNIETRRAAHAAPRETPLSDGAGPSAAEFSRCLCHDKLREIRDDFLLTLGAGKAPHADESHAHEDHPPHAAPGNPAMDARAPNADSQPPVQTEQLKSSFFSLIEQGASLLGQGASAALAWISGSTEPEQPLTTSFLKLDDSLDKATRLIKSMDPSSGAERLTNQEAGKALQALYAEIHAKLEAQLKDLKISELTPTERAAFLKDLDTIQRMQGVIQAYLEDHIKAAEALKDKVTEGESASAGPDASLAAANETVDSALAQLKELHAQNQAAYDEIEKLRPLLTNGGGDSSVAEVCNTMTNAICCGHHTLCAGHELAESTAHEVQNHVQNSNLKPGRKEQLFAAVAEYKASIEESYNAAMHAYVEAHQSMVETLLTVGQRWPNLIEGYAERYDAISNCWEPGMDNRWTVGSNDGHLPYEQRKLFMFVDETNRYEAAFWRSLWRGSGELSAQEDPRPGILSQKEEPSLAAQRPELIKGPLEFSVIPDREKRREIADIKQQLERRGRQLSPGSEPSASDRLTALAAEALTDD